MNATIDRRTFLASCATGVAWACTRPAAGGGDSIQTVTAIPIGLQLYTLRKDMQADFEGTLTRVAEIGYKEVEFAGYYGRTPAAVRALLDRLKLDAPASHVGGASTLEGNWTRIIDDARAAGHEWLVCPWIDDKERTLDHYRRHADTFNRLGEVARRAGLRFAYHNHDFEFARAGDVLPFDILLERTDPANVAFELDLYWTIKGGADPLAYFKRFPGRFPLLHIKDMTSDGRMVDVGAGSIDFRGILAQRAQAGVQHMFVEHDNPAPDGLTSVRRSFQHLSTLKP